MAITERFIAIIESRAEGALKGLDDLGASAHKTGGLFDNLAAKANSKLESVGIQGRITGGMLEAGLVAGATAAATAIGTFAAKGVQQFVDLAGEVRNLQRAVGGSAEDASKLRAILDDYEIPVDAATGAFARLGRTIESNPEKLNAFGVSVARTADGNVDLQRTLGNVADAYQATTDPAARAALGTAAFGRSYQSLVPILEGGSSRIRQAFDATSEGQILSQEQLDKAEDFRLAMDELGDATGDLQRALGEALIPALKDLVETVGPVVEVTTDATKAWQDFTDGGIGRFVKQAIDLANPVGAANRAIGSLKSLTDQYERATGAAEDTTDALDDQGRTQADLEKATADAEAALDDQADAQKDLERATREAEQAIRDQTDAVLDAVDKQHAYEGAVEDAAEALGKLNDAALASLDPTKDATQTQRDYEAALRDAEGKLLDQARAATELAVKQAEASGTTVTAAERNQILRDELLKVAQALGPGSPLYGNLQGYAARLAAVPSRVNTVVTVNVDDARRQVSDLRLSVEELQARFDRIITLNAGGGVRRFASGGTTSRPTEAIIGEAGVPERVILPAGAQVTPMLRGDARAGGTGPIVVHTHVMVDGREIAAAVRRIERAGR